MRRTRHALEEISARLTEVEQQAAALEPLIAAKPILPSEGDVAAFESPQLHEPPETVQPIARWEPERIPRRTPPPPSDVLGREAEVRLGQKWLLIVGIATTVLAVGYFLKYSFDRNWVGPAGRVAMAYLAGVAMLGVGEMLRRRRFDVFGLYLMGGGIAVLYFAGYAGFQIYHLFSQVPAFVLMTVVTAFAGLLALSYGQIWLAVLGITGGFLTPVVLSTGTDNQAALMTYMVVLNGGILVLAVFKQWRLLNHLGLVFTWLLFSAWYVRHYHDEKFWTTTVFLNLFFLIHACVPFAYYVVRRTHERVTGFALTIPNTFIAFGYSYVTIRGYSRLEWVSVASVAYAAIFLAMASHLYRKNRENLEPFVLLLAKGLFFLILTVPLLFSKHWITLFWNIQGLVLLWAALRLTDARLRGGAVVLLILATAKFVFYDYPTVFRLNVFELSFPGGGFQTLMLERWVTTAVTAGVLLSASRMLHAAGLGRGDWRENPVTIFRLLFGMLLFLSLNVETAAFFYEAAPRARFASISVLWALFAAALMVLGFVRDRAVLRRCAIGLFAVTVLKVFVRDMARVETPYRILSFLVVGLMLVAASYLYHRFAARILPPPKNPETPTP